MVVKTLYGVAEKVHTVAVWLMGWGTGASSVPTLGMGFLKPDGSYRLAPVGVPASAWFEHPAVAVIDAVQYDATITCVDPECEHREDIPTVLVFTCEANLVAFGTGSQRSGVTAWLDRHGTLNNWPVKRLVRYTVATDGVDLVQLHSWEETGEIVVDSDCSEHDLSLLRREPIPAALTNLLGRLTAAIETAPRPARKGE